jgi:hypothetical protein
MKMKHKRIDVPGYSGIDRRSGVDRRQSKGPYMPAAVKLSLSRDWQVGSDQRKRLAKK